MTQPLVEQTWEVWLVLRLAALGASVLGSSWLLRATCKQPTVYLFNCQLRHLALADLCLSLVDPGYELAVWAIWPVGAGLPPLFNICCRGLFHALLCVVCFVEAQIAAGVMGSALHSQRCFSLLAKLLVFAWPAAAAVGAVDAVAMHLHTEGQRAFGFTKVLEVAVNVSDVLGGSPAHTVTERRREARILACLGLSVWLPHHCVSRLAALHPGHPGERVERPAGELGHVQQRLGECSRLRLPESSSMQLGGGSEDSAG